MNIQAGPFAFRARLELDLAPRTCAAFIARLPFESRLVQARWSGESGWIPLGDLELGTGYENEISEPAPGQILWHPPGKSEAELLFPYGVTRFSSKVGELRGNHFLTITDGAEQLGKLGERLLWSGAQDIRFTA
jgi:hypothetical protein